uniref:Large ribosomal subunit protein bL20c n=1 Tax=Prasinococcus sp. CCMP1194 TaxID=110672 RepID=A0A088CJS8_9VIRI|nr:ribosomal protein L20 [Prasinococcus sp. CCMP1194]
MTRIKRGFIRKNRRKKIMKLAKGFQGSHSKLFRVANQQVMRALKYAYYDRKKKKTFFRQIWITRINASTRNQGLAYSSFIGLVKKSNILLNRKSLAHLVVHDEAAFKKIIKTLPYA